MYLAVHQGTPGLIGRRLEASYCLETNVLMHLKVCFAVGHGRYLPEGDSLMKLMHHPSVNVCCRA